MIRFLSHLEIRLNYGKTLSLSRLDNFVDFLSNKIRNNYCFFFVRISCSIFFSWDGISKKNYPRVLQINSHEQRSKKSESRHQKLQSLPQSHISGLGFDWDCRDINLECRPLVMRPLILKKMICQIYLKAIKTKIKKLSGVYY